MSVRSFQQIVNDHADNKTFRAVYIGWRDRSGIRKGSTRAVIGAVYDVRLGSTEIDGDTIYFDDQYGSPANRHHAEFVKLV